MPEIFKNKALQRMKLGSPWATVSFLKASGRLDMPLITAE